MCVDLWWSGLKKEIKKRLFKDVFSKSKRRHWIIVQENNATFLISNFWVMILDFFLSIFILQKNGHDT